MPKLRPFTLSPVLVEKPWGGRRLADYGKPLPEGVMIGESWEIEDLPGAIVPHIEDPQSRVASGPLAGCSLRSVIDQAGEELLGPVMPTSEGRFPLLVKLLDARENLSVQVHPPEAYVDLHPEARLKTESWYVIGGDPGSQLFLGFKEDTDLNAAKRTIGSSALVPQLRTVDALPGGFHHVPAGLVHSIGAGVMLAEVQVPSDTTFRLYDWADEYNRTPRQMHFDEGAASILLHPQDALSEPPVSESGVRDLTVNQHYWMREHRHATSQIELSSQPGPRVIMVISGRVSVGDVSLGVGSTAIVPAVAIAEDVVVARSAVFLEIGLTV